MNKLDRRHRIALSQAGLDAGANFFIVGLPPPLVVTYNDHSVERDQNQGGMARLGYDTIEYLWFRLTVQQANILDGLVTSAETSGGQGNGVLFVTVPKTIASGRWIDCSGKAHRPNWADFTDRNMNGLSYANVRFRLNNVSVLADPSTVT